MNNNSLINKEIITFEAGIGKISGVEKLYGDEDFIQVVFESLKSTSYYSMNSEGKFRFIENKEVILKAIEIFKSAQELKVFQSVQDKINHYKSSLKNNNICNLAKSLSELKSEEDLHAQLKVVYSKVLDSFVLEIKHTLNIRLIDAWRLIEVEKSKKLKKK